MPRHIRSKEETKHRNYWPYTMLNIKKAALPCNSCGGEDTVALFENGSSHCFKCDTHFNPTNPEHYKSSIQPIEFIEANNLDFFEGNIVKYVSRWRKKNGLEDLKKAQWYLERLVNNITRGDTNVERQRKETT